MLSISLSYNRQTECHRIRRMPMKSSLLTIKLPNQQFWTTMEVRKWPLLLQIVKRVSFLVIHVKCIDHIGSHGGIPQLSRWCNSWYFSRIITCNIIWRIVRYWWIIYHGDVCLEFSCFPQLHPEFWRLVCFEAGLFWIVLWLGSWLGIRWDLRQFLCRSKINRTIMLLQPGAIGKCVTMKLNIIFLNLLAPDLKQMDQKWHFLGFLLVLYHRT